MCQNSILVLFLYPFSYIPNYIFLFARFITKWTLRLSFTQHGFDYLRLSHNTFNRQKALDVLISYAITLLSLTIFICLFDLLAAISSVKKEWRTYQALQHARKEQSWLEHSFPLKIIWRKDPKQHNCTS